MPAHTDTQVLPYSALQLFDLVADVERYPEFIPWCKAARIIPPPPLPLGEGRGEGSVIYAELLVSFSHVNERYTSQVTLTPPAGDMSPCAIEAKMISGPFEHLINNWTFTPEGAGTRVDFLIDFKFRSKMLDLMMGGLFGKAVAKMSEAFRTRANALYGGKG